MEETPDNAKIAEVDLMMVVIVTVSASITANETAMMTLGEVAEAQEEIIEAEVKAKERPLVSHRHAPSPFRRTASRSERRTRCSSPATQTR